MKNNLLCTPGKRVLFLSETYPGSVHDKAICDEESYTFPCGIILDQDAGYQGHAPEGVVVRQPQKKPRGKPRSPEQKAYNRACSRHRVVVEHAMACASAGGCCATPCACAATAYATCSWNSAVACTLCASRTNDRKQLVGINSNQF